GDRLVLPDLRGPLHARGGPVHLQEQVAAVELGAPVAQLQIDLAVLVDVDAPRGALPVVQQPVLIAVEGPAAPHHLGAVAGAGPENHPLRAPAPAPAPVP